MAFFITGCSDSSRKVGFEAVKTPEELIAHSREFKKEIIKVNEKVYVAVGYALANIIMIEGEDGVIIVDTTESVEAAMQIREEFLKITDKPVKAIIYTHNHADHVLGTGVFAKDSDPEIYAHELTAGLVDRAINELRPIVSERGMRMFGIYLENEAMVNAGVGPFLAASENHNADYLKPTKTFVDKMSVEIAGVQIELIHAPGETDDHLFVWLPDEKVMLPGDTVYKSFPNLYTIRGTQYRDPMQWVAAIDKLRSYHPEHLVLSHGQPIEGAENITNILTDYRDGIQYVYDQTIRGMNKGMMPDELAKQVKLPEHLAKSPYLQEFYGKVEWGVRTVFDGNLGWYSGSPSTLLPLGLKDRAQRYIQLAGGQDSMIREAEEALKKADHQWALELTDYLMAVDPDNEIIKKIRISALTRLGETEANANARHYYLTMAAELRDGFRAAYTGTPSAESLRNFSTKGFFRLLASSLVPEKSIDADIKTGFVFPDVNEEWTVHVRRGVAEVQPYLMKDLSYKLTLDSQVWKEMLAQVRNPAIAVASSEVEVEGGSIGFLKFLTMFKK